MSKTRLYEAFIQRLEIANDAGFHLEACWLAYSIFEDRTASILKALGSPANNKSLYDKIKYLENLALGKSALGVYFNYDQRPTVGASGSQKFDVLENLDSWRNRRNGLIHRMADGQAEIAAIDQDVKTLSDESVALVRTVAAVARRVKKNARHLL